jgi:hypothetical protein
MHHSRRKSGHGSTNSSMTDVRKAGSTADASRSRRPQTLTRKSTPQTLQKLGKSPRNREREWEQDQWSEEERESFPQYWYVSHAIHFSLFTFVVSPLLRLRSRAVHSAGECTRKLHLWAPRCGGWDALSHSHINHALLGALGCKQRHHMMHSRRGVHVFPVGGFDAAPAS